MNEAYLLAVKLLGAYSRTEKEIRQKLQQKKFPLASIETAIQTLKEEGYLDDRKYVEEWLRQTLAHRPCGPHLCRQKLRQKGVTPDIIDRLLPQKYPPELEKEIAQKILTKKMRTLSFESSSRSSSQLLAKLSRFLAAKGFSHALIADLIESFNLTPEP